MATAEAEPRTGLEPLYEVVDGQAVETPRMGAYETCIATLLGNAIGTLIQRQPLGRVEIESLYWLDQPGLLQRRPDVSFVSYERWPRNQRVPREESWNVVPDLAVEIISRSNTADDVVDKLADYFRAGVRVVWVVYPSQSQVYAYTSPTTVRILSPGETLEGGRVLPGFQHPVAALFDDSPESP